MEFVYLAGPMEDCTKEYAASWRESAAAQFLQYDVYSLDPTRRISMHERLGTLVSEGDRDTNICKRIFKQDMQDIAQSNVILADCRRDSGKGIGTSMELMFAHTKNKIIILWVDKKDMIHPFYESIYTEKHYYLEDAIEAALEYFS